MLSLRHVLDEVEPGRLQSVGHMQVIPLLGQDDPFFSPPELQVGTTGYGSVCLSNESERPTIVPTGAAWVVKQCAQDHAVGGATLLPAKSEKTVDTARCIQQSQGGLIKRERHRLLVLPWALRHTALMLRRESGYDKLWPAVSKLNGVFGLQEHGHLEYFLRGFAKQLDEFVAELELVPQQVGAIVLVAGKVVGIERAPSHAFWRCLWEPLIRVCYGSLALQWQRHDRAPRGRIPLRVRQPSLEGLRDALLLADAEARAFVAVTMSSLASHQLERLAHDEQHGGATLTTLCSSKLSGQVVTRQGGARYASLCVKVA